MAMTREQVREMVAENLDTDARRARYNVDWWAEHSPDADTSDDAIFAEEYERAARLVRGEG